MYTRLLLFESNIINTKQQQNQKQNIPHDCSTFFAVVVVAIRSVHSVSFSEEQENEKRMLHATSEKTLHTLNEALRRPLSLPD